MGVGAGFTAGGWVFGVSGVFGGSGLSRDWAHAARLKETTAMRASPPVRNRRMVFSFGRARDKSTSPDRCCAPVPETSVRHPGRTTSPSRSITSESPGREIPWAYQLSIMPGGHPGKQFDHRLIKSWDVARLPTGDPVGVFYDFTVQPVTAGIADVVLNSVVAGEPPAAHQVGGDENPRRMANDRHRLAGILEVLDERLDLRHDAEGVGIQRAAGQKEGVVV